MHHVKINEQAQLLASQSQMGEKLGLVNRRNCLNCFQFYYDAIVYNQIDSIPEIKFHAFVNERQRNFALNIKSGLAEFERQTRLICALQQTRPKIRMNSQSTANNSPADNVFFANLSGLCV